MSNRMPAAETDDGGGVRTGSNADNKQTNRTTVRPNVHDTTLHGFRSGARDVQIEFSIYSIETAK